MPEYSAIENIPEDWSRKIRCPICCNKFINIERFENKPDYAHCPNCGISFQIEKKGQHILFMEFPINFLENMKGRWLSQIDIEDALQRNGNQVHITTSQINTSKPMTKKPNLVRAEAVRRARSLVELKNSPDTIRAALKDTVKLSAADIEEIIKDAFSVYDELQKQRNKKIMVYSVFIVVFMIVFFVFLNFII